MKIGGTTTNQILGIALSSSQVSFCSVVEGSDGIRLVDLPELNTSLGGEGLILSLSWNDTKLAASTQNSSLVVCDVRNDSSSIEVVHQIENAHQLLGENVPVWITAFDIHDKNRLVSGGDDMCLKMWDLRESGSSGPISFNKKTHGAGVTAVCNLFV